MWSKEIKGVERDQAGARGCARVHLDQTELRDKGTKPLFLCVFFVDISAYYL